MLAGLALVLLAAAVGYAALGPDEETFSYVIRAVPAPPDGTPIVILAASHVERFPPPAREGWREAATNGNAAFTLNAAEAEDYGALLREAAEAQGVPGASTFRWEGKHYQFSAKMP